jgi:elongation factor P
MAMTMEISRGMIIKYNGEPHVIIEKEFYSPGKGGSFNKTKLKSIKTGKIVANVFKSEERVEEIEVTTMTVQYVYIDGNNAVFMDPNTYEQMNVSLDIIEYGTDFLHTEAKYIAKVYEGDVIFLQLPPKITLEVTETPDAVKGDTTSGAYKDATLETGAVVKVPLFIKAGQKIVISTENRSYFSKE